MQQLRGLPVRVAGVELQIVQFREARVIFCNAVGATGRNVRDSR
jgi:hypothetical protein